MSTGKISLYPLAEAVPGSVAVSPGPIIWVMTHSPDGVGAFNLRMGASTSLRRRSHRPTVFCSRTARSG